MTGTMIKIIKRKSVAVGCRLAFFYFLLFSTTLAADQPDTDHAVILLYHNVSDTTPASTSVTPAVFDSHLEFLQANHFNVLPLQEIISALQAKRPLPPRSVALTFDDAYLSIATEALPRLQKRGWPFTVFVSTNAVDSGYKGYMNWSQLRVLEAGGATIANHSRTHDHFIRRRSDEGEGAWRKRVLADIAAAQDRLNSEMTDASALFAWPYGEFNEDLRELIGDVGMVGFGQQSGPAGHSSDMQSLPRFPLATNFASISSLAEKLRSRPLPVEVMSPHSGVLPAASPAPTLTVRIPDGDYRLADLRCFVAGQNSAEVVSQKDTFVFIARERLGPGRSKYTCTAPSSTESGVYYWFSYLWMQPHDDGTWYSE